VVYEEVEVVELLVVLALWPLVRSSVVLAERLPADAGAGKFAWLDPTPFGS
jgi:hypothetical protein